MNMHRDRFDSHSGGTGKVRRAAGLRPQGATTGNHGNKWLEAAITGDRADRHHTQDPDSSLHAGSPGFGQVLQGQAPEPPNIRTLFQSGLHWIN
jgi:hypothetical protein